MKKKRKHITTKNTVAKPPVTRLAVIEGECNGKFKIVTDFCTQNEMQKFDEIYREWFDHPDTVRWCIESFMVYFKLKYPNRICLLYEDYEKFTKGKAIPATKEEWESENN